MRKRIVIIAVALVLVAAGAAGVIALRRAFSGGEPAAEQDNETQDASDETPLVQDENAKAVTMAEAPVFTTTTESGITVTAPDAFLENEAMSQVQDEISLIEGRGNTVCVVLLDLNTRRGISYNTDALMYPASSIKASYCAWIFESHSGAAGMSGTVADCLINSSNDAYHAVLGTFGLSSYAAWLSSHGAARAAETAGYRYYPMTTAGELAIIWEEIYRYGTSGEAGAEELTGYLAQTNRSPIGEELRDTCDVWSKPGWYPADGNGLQSSNDAGIVFSETGPYVMVIMSDISSDLESLKPLIRALSAAHETMCGDTVAYYE